MVHQQLYHQNFFSLHQNLLPALDPATYGYGYLGWYFDFNAISQLEINQST